MPEKNKSQDVGKKIADALKAQGDVDDLFVDEISAEDFLKDEEESFEDFSNAFEIPAEASEEIEPLDIFEESKPKKAAKSTISIDESKPKDEYVPIFKVDQADVDENPELKLTIDAEDTTDEFEMPNNINVLKRLIGQLPSGVPKQTGAQIIRQTIEALGIPMKSVLQDAQRAKDCLNSSIKDCTFTIQEYKSNIRNLEKQSLSYQKQLAKLNDIIGLFVYGEKNNYSVMHDFKKSS